jgi:ABC-type bacteriocin/lantibiotic exporter with double-glycine peptidase domain
VLLVPLGLLAAYGALRFSTVLFTELREIFFARVTQRAVRTITLQVFEHLHSLSLRFHLDRQTGGLTRDIERGTRSIGSLISYTLYSILPTLVEIALVLGILACALRQGFHADHGHHAGDLRGVHHRRHQLAHGAAARGQ